MKPVCILIALLASVAWGQQPGATAAPGGQQSKSDKETPTHSMTDMTDMAGMGAMHAMEGHMDMGPHMKMTPLRPARNDDAERAERVVEAARKVAAKYVAYHSALADGYEIFFPEVPQKIYHFVNPEYAREAALSFNAEHPTALLYEKHGDDYKLIGVMYTAPRGFSEEQLDKRIPLSVAQWHQHVNVCVPPADRRKKMLEEHAQFGLLGSISTSQACDAAGGIFRPVVFNWMVHVYPFERDPKRIWSVERQSDAGGASSAITSRDAKIESKTSKQ